MFVIGLETLVENLTSYYIVAVCASALAIIVSLYYSLKPESEKKNPCDGDEINASSEMTGQPTEKLEDELASAEGEEPKGMKKTPARMAEMVIEANMTQEQRTLELEIRKQQLAEIYKLMQRETEKFGDVSIMELEEQMKLYQ